MSAAFVSVLSSWILCDIRSPSYFSAVLWPHLFTGSTRRMEFPQSGVPTHRRNSSRWFVAPCRVRPGLIDIRSARSISGRSLTFLIGEDAAPGARLFLVLTAILGFNGWSNYYVMALCRGKHHCVMLLLTKCWNLPGRPFLISKSLTLTSGAFISEARKSAREIFGLSFFSQVVTLRCHKNLCHDCD